MPSRSFFIRTTVALKPSLINSSKTSVVSRCQRGLTGFKPISAVILSSQPVSCSATSNMSPVIMPSAPLFLAFCRAWMKFCWYVSGVVSALMMGMLSDCDCASRSWVGIMWKLLFVLSCIIMSRFWTLSPCCCALWSANALSFPPDHEVMSFMMFFLLFCLRSMGFRCGWFIQLWI